MKPLFSKNIALQLPDSDIVYYPNFLGAKEADHYFKSINATTPWQQDDITVFGKTYPQPRLTALFGENSNPYSYSNITMHPHAFTAELLELRNKLQMEIGVHFTSCLLNLYRNGKDSNGWHADDEKALGKNPIIASISLGQERYFHLKHKLKKDLKQKLLLEHGSLLLMKGETQHCWYHQIPKTSKTIQERINITFRVIK
ncbi:alpha-ketoglutarate-dependent dioxygenase AlkB family protein [Arenibacter troitsensis]|uniref:Alkylated DNA repair dioxygenase AlkB n=1 Tax=Arenibacter troitsensis TaxID=188872 RepID=A0A1X7LEI7_9FLAO|nr:alpha-ketoglutarate-dependent dioxygenase AlkB [Arenibacter troitsensis]SMG52251.1 Alkylated DNA repair dioxygenase AlkB [Arenibacter troitsensis]